MTTPDLSPTAVPETLDGPPKDVLRTLRDPATIRLRCAEVTRAVENNVSPHFTLDRTRLDEVAARVEALIRRRFPDLRIPLHSRWRHFEAGGVDRRAELDARLAGRSALDRARAHIDLTVVSVLLDAGAGSKWQYTEHRKSAQAALPVHRQGRDDLLAMLDAAAKGRAAEPPTAPGPGETAEAPAAEGAGEAAASATSAPVAAPVASDAAAPRFARSEGLGVATFRAFLDGVFSADRDDPLRADAATLQQMDAAAVRALFQSSPSNPLMGLEGRAGLMTRLGSSLHLWRHGPDGDIALPLRPSAVLEPLTEGFTRAEVPAAELFGVLLRAFAPIWTSGSRVLGAQAGDVWPHRWSGDAVGDGRDPTTVGWVPFHKLTQWLTYSLLEPLQWAGVKVTGLDALTGLPEYRNGGLLLDAGVIVPRVAADLDRVWTPKDEFIVEWRALTVTLLDEVAERVRARLGLDAEALPLPCVLEGGTWAAGREIAAERRPGGAPPLRLDSDGTVF